MKQDQSVVDDRAGFSLIEMLTAIGLIGIMLGVGASRIDTSTWKISNAAAEISQRARSARSMAVLRQHDVRVTFDVGDARIIIHQDADNDGVVGPDELVFRYKLEAVELSRSNASPYAGYDGGPVTFANNTVTFVRNGSASAEGAVYVATANGERVRAVVISRPTGSTHVMRYNGSAWVNDVE